MIGHRLRSGGGGQYDPQESFEGVDVESGLVHTVTTTPANVADVTETDKLLHGQERSVWADAGYTGAEQRLPRKRGRIWHIAAKRGRIKALPESKTGVRVHFP